MLGPHDVVVFLGRPEALADPERRAEALATLAPEDAERLVRFHFDRDREIALASRALQRRALSLCAPVAPEAWRFVAGPHGRPEVAAPVGGERLRFNVANTAGLVMCAVTLDRELGVDVEPRRDDAPADIVDSHFAPAERAALRALATADRPVRFVELWTLKEAYLKARSVGLTVPMDRFWFELGATVPQLTIDPELGDDAASWQLALWAPTPEHCAALCVRRGAGPDLSIQHRWI